jgi:hypothetical protein
MPNPKITPDEAIAKAVETLKKYNLLITAGDIVKFADLYLNPPVASNSDET